MNTQQLASLKKSLVHPARTTLAVALALIAAKGLGLPEVYWAPISTFIVMQSTLGGALKVSGQRLLGTAIGAAAGALFVTWFGASLPAYALGVFGLGILFAFMGQDRTAYRFAGITLTVIMLAAHGETAWIAGLHRFAEVSVGIGVGLAVTAVWRDHGESGAWK